MLGTVESVDGMYAKVSIERQDMCGECHACEMLGEVKKCEIKCHNICQSQVGDLVEIDLEQNRFFKATYLMYGLPLVGLMVGLGGGAIIPLGEYSKFQEILMVILGLGGMTSMLFWLNARDQKQKFENFLPRLTQIMNEKECEQ